MGTASESEHSNFSLLPVLNKIYCERKDDKFSE